jgi:hypothetical protein
MFKKGKTQKKYVVPLGAPDANGRVIDFGHLSRR